MTLPPRPARAALLLVDVQGDFLDPSLGELGDGYPGRVARLLDVIRSAGLLVVHVHSLFAPDRSDWMRRYRGRGAIPCVRGTAGAEIVPEARPVDGEPVVVKQSFDGFLRTELAEVLRSEGVEVVLVAGLVTSTCVLFTAASAMQLGFTVAVVEDAVADDPWVQKRVLSQYAYMFDRTTIDSALTWVDAAVAASERLGPLRPAKQ